MAKLTEFQLRQFILQAHGMATQRYVQTDSEMRRRIGELLTQAISRDEVMRGWLTGTSEGAAIPPSEDET